MAMHDPPHPGTHTTLRASDLLMILLPRGGGLKAGDETKMIDLCHKYWYTTRKSR